MTASGFAGPPTRGQPDDNQDTGQDEGESDELPGRVLLRPTIQHPGLSEALTDDDRRAVHLKLIRDSDARPVDALHVHGYAPREDARIVEKALWHQL